VQFICNIFSGTILQYCCKDRLVSTVLQKTNASILDRQMIWNG